MDDAAVIRHDACNGSQACFVSGCVLCERNMILKLRDLPVPSVDELFEMLSSVDEILQHHTPIKRDPMIPLHPQRCLSPVRKQKVSRGPIQPYVAARRLDFDDPCDDTEDLHFLYPEMRPEIIRRRHTISTPIRREIRSDSIVSNDGLPNYISNIKPPKKNLWVCKHCGYDGGGQCDCCNLF